MASGGPPSSRPYLAQEPTLVNARGKLRDGLGSLRNLDQLLKSLRVGPKALKGVLPDIKAACSECGKAAEQLLNTVGMQPRLTEAASELNAYWQPRLRQLESALDRAERLTLNAKLRLELEVSVEEVSRELEIALELLDLLEEVVWAPAFPLEIAELMRETLAEPTDRHNALSVSVSGLTAAGEVTVQPRVMVALVRLGANWVASKADSAHIDVATESGRVVLTMRSGLGQGEPATLRRRSLPELTLTCVRAAMSHVSCELEASDGRIVLRGFPTSEN